MIVPPDKNIDTQSPCSVDRQLKFNPLTQKKSPNNSAPVNPRGLVGCDAYPIDDTATHSDTAAAAESEATPNSAPSSDSAALDHLSRMPGDE
jgi:hypothetical protein